MTVKKTETKRTRRPSVTAAEIRRREETQQARKRISGLDGIELASRVRTIGLKQAAIFDYELLLHVANILDAAGHGLEQVLPSPIPGVGGGNNDEVVT